MCPAAALAGMQSRCCCLVLAGGAGASCVPDFRLLRGILLFAALRTDHLLSFTATRVLLWRRPGPACDMTSNGLIAFPGEHSHEQLCAL